MLYSLLILIVAIVIVGFILFLINRFIPMEPNYKSMVNILGIVILVIVVSVWLFQTFNIAGFLKAH